MEDTVDVKQSRTKRHKNEENNENNSVSETVFYLSLKIVRLQKYSERLLRNNILQQE